MANSMLVFGAKPPLELIEKVSEYSMYDISDKIKCPTLLLAGEKDHSLLIRLKNYMICLTVQRNTSFIYN